jgi:predicted membrane metal-binding protein
MGSERSFGLVFAIVFAIIALWPLPKGGLPHWWAIAASAAFLASGYLWPVVLRPLNIAWFRLGLLLSTIVTPVVMALLYLTTFVPTALVIRLAGRDLLGLKREPDRESYWTVRDGSNACRGTMQRQF